MVICKKPVILIVMMWASSVQAYDVNLLAKLVAEASFLVGGESACQLFKKAAWRSISAAHACCPEPEGVTHIVIKDAILGVVAAHPFVALITVSFFAGLSVAHGFELYNRRAYPLNGLDLVAARQGILAYAPQRHDERLCVAAAA